MKINPWCAVVMGGLAACPALAEPYIRASAGVNQSRVEDLTFINPVGATVTSNPVDGDKILLSNVKSSTTRSVWGLGLGYRFKKLPFRTELRFDARDTVEASGYATFFGSDVSQRLRIESTALMGYLFYDATLYGPHQVFVGAGAGVSRNQSSGTQGENLGLSNTFPAQTKNDLAYGVSLGYAYKLDSAITLDVEYSYVDLGKASTGATSDPAPAGMSPGEQLTGKLAVQELRFGVRWSFGGLR